MKPNPGDVVQIKNGPAMTVETILDDGAAQCVWFDAELHLQRARFATDALLRAEPPPVAPKS